VKQPFTDEQQPSAVFLERRVPLGLHPAFASVPTQMKKAPRARLSGCLATWSNKILVDIPHHLASMFPPAAMTGCHFVKVNKVLTGNSAHVVIQTGQ